ncbi:hypothetical protein [Methylobacterium radiodurans]|uniref:hypothetical protein n=1 Tax=Methylobacterium radiodurans TaxID=2202828 RepID=UPI001FE42B98|nr:hypothetical protein [Methylobacterium radiodurans]
MIALSAFVPGSLYANQVQSRICRPTLAEFKTLEMGMSYEEVAAQLGCKGRRISHIEIGRNRRATYSWQGRGSYGANLNATFRNNRLTDLSQLGLR